MRFRIVLILILILLNLNTNLQAQFSGEYIYNPQLAMSGDGRIIAVSGRSVIDSIARLGGRYPIDFYDTATGNLINSFDGSEDNIEGLSLNSDGSMLAYNNNNGRLAIVEVQTGNEINVIEAGGFADIGYPVWSPDDSAIATFFGTNIELYNALPPRDRLFNYYDNFTTGVSGFDWSENSNIIVFSTRNAQTSEGTLAIIQVLPDFEMELVKTIDAPAAITVSLSDDGTAVAINTQHGVLITNLDDESQFLLPKVNVGDATLSLDWSVDGTKIAAGGFETITVWDTQTHEIIQSITTESIVSSAIWSPDGQYIYHTGGTAGVYRDGLPLQEAILRSGNEQ